jgi:FkbM family methyltransferase
MRTTNVVSGWPWRPLRIGATLSYAAAHRRLRPEESELVTLGQSVRDTGRVALTRTLKALSDEAAETLRRRAPRPVLHIMRYRGLPDAEWFSLLDDTPIRFAVADSVVLERVYWLGTGGYEPRTLQWWQDCCSRAHRVLELGANVGYFTVQGASRCRHGQYLAVEPHPVSAGAIRRNVDLNQLTHVELLEAAAVDDPDVVSATLRIPAQDHFGAPAGAFVGGEAQEFETMRSFEVRAVPAPGLFADVDLVKLDIEGHEHRVLLAAWHQIIRNLPTIFVEVLPDTRELRELLATLCRDHGYVCLVPGKRYLTRMPPAKLLAASPRALGGRDVIMTVDKSLLARAI